MPRSPSRARPGPATLLLLTLLMPLSAALGQEGNGPDVGAAEADAEPPFDVWEYRVQGNTLLPGVAIEKAVYPLLGSGKRLADVEAARTAVEQAYRDAGYATVFVDIPEQQVTGGLVRLNVTEGRVGSFRVTGARYFSAGWIRDQIPAATPGGVPRLGDFQRQLRQVSLRSGDRSITPILRPGREAGTVDVELKVQDRVPLNGSVELNNRNVPNTTSSRLSANVRYDNLWQRDHSLSLQYNVAPEEPDETTVLVGSYILRPKDSPLTWAVYAVKSDSDIAVAVSDLSVLGKGTIVGGRLIVPLPAGEGSIQGLALGFDYKDFDEIIGFNDPEGPPDLTTPISWLNWSATWNGAWLREGYTQGLELGINFGLRNAGNSTSEFEERRLRGRANYVYLTAGYDLTRSLPWGSQGYLSLNGQLTPQPLVTVEQFNAGGLDTVRGYFESEVLGDYGVQAQVEWRSPNLGPRLWDGIDSLVGYTFVDWATLRLLQAPAAQQDSATVYSGGIGLRLRVAAVTAGLDWAFPFKDGASTEAGDHRLLGLIRMDF
jgi:hemolysin activation/secretion protein